MTDPDYYSKNYPIEIGEAILIVSLSAEPYVKNDKNYGYPKFIAKIFEL